MVGRVGSIDVLLRVSYGDYERDMVRASRLTEREGGRMQGAVRRSEQSVHGLSRALSGLRGVLLATSTLFGGFGAAFTLKGIADYSDTYKEVGNRLRIVKGEAESLASVEQKIFETAQKSRAQYEATGVLYARIANSARRLGVSSKDVLRVTETIQKAFLVGGATPTEAAQSSIQLSQGIASNRLQGDELRSVLENPALVHLLADRITQGDSGKLRKIAAEGELTAGVIIRAFKDASDEIDRLFDTTEKTIGSAFARLDNALMRYIGTSEKVKTGTGATVSAVNFLADNIDGVVDSVLLLGYAAAASIGGKMFNNFRKAVGVTRQLKAEAASAAAAELKMAQGAIPAARNKMLRDRLAVNAAYREGAMTTKQISRLESEAARSTMAHRAAVTRATAAQTAYNATARTGNAITNAGAVAMRGFGNAAKATYAFLGGPVGVALIALGGAFYLLQKEAQAASERSERYSDVIERAGQESEVSSASIRKASEAMREVAHSTMGAAERISAVKKASDDMSALGAALTRLNLFDAFNKTAIALQALGQQYVRGAITLEEYIAKTNELAASDHDFADQIKANHKTAQSFLAVKFEMIGIKSAADDLDGSVANVKIKIDMDQVKSDLNTALTKQLDDLLKDAIKEGENPEHLRLRMFPELFDDVEPKKKSSRAKKSDAEKQIESLDKALDKLDYKAASFDLSNVDKETIETARSAGVAESKIRAFIQALDTGGAVPAELAQIKSRLQAIADLEFGKALSDLREKGVLTQFSELDQEVIKLARDFGVSEAAVTSFMMSLTGQGGGISAEMQKIKEALQSNEIQQSFADFKEGSIGIIEDSLMSLHDMFWDAETSAEDFARNAAKAFSKLAFQLLIVEPLIRSIRSSLSGGYVPAGAGGDDPWAGKRSVTVGTQHKGGDAGAYSGRRTVSMGAFSNGIAKHHTGMKSDEYMALLQKGERVATAAQTAYEASVVKGLTAAASKATGGGSGGTVVNIHNGTGEKVTQRQSNTGGVDVVDVFIGEVDKAIKSGRMDGSMAAQYGAKAKTRDYG